MTTQTWTPEPLTFTPVEAYGPLYASWLEAGDAAVFEVRMRTRFGTAARAAYVGADQAVGFHRQGYIVERVR